MLQVTEEELPAARTQAWPFRAVLLAWLLVSLTATGFLYSAAHAQVPPGQILPPLPPPPARELELLPRERVFVREIRVTGSTVFSTEELAEVTAPYVNRELTAEDLEAVRLALTLLYVNKGYVNSGAILPDQTVTEGVIRFQIIEGEITSIEVQGNQWFRASYLQKRLLLGAGPPLNVNALQQQIQLLLEDPRIQRLTAEVKPGLKPGEAVLSVVVEERTPYRLWLDFNNYQSPSVGAERGIINLEHQNLTGNGDILTLQYGISDGVNPLLDFKYSLPFTARDTTLILQYRKNTSTVIEEPFTDLDIDSKSDIYTLTLRQPVYRTLNSEFALELTGELLSQKTFLLGEPFSLSPGAQQGKSDDTAVRTAQEWVYRTQNQVLAARSRFSVGIDAFDATINPAGVPDGQFFAWLGQFQWVRRLGILDTQLIFRSDLQLAADRLLALEQIAVGGRYTVRGYRENTLVRDNAFLASLEARLPLVRNARWADFLELAPFVDYGRAWNTDLPTPDPKDISSVGVGLRWGLTISSPVPLRTYFEVYWGHPFRDVRTSGDLQDEGFHFQFIFGAY
ncbi:MAG: ShlB/FhaC/HecB family hemolysin secretion/activation protein [Acidobacteria bacterium]|nr:ShlB/FhaC/HecB family hemolysin secretion/activation protein [Acidobacteriota bacterium]